MHFSKYVQSFALACLLAAGCSSTDGTGQDTDAGGGDDIDSGTTPGVDAGGGGVKDGGSVIDTGGPQACSATTCAGCCFNGVCQTGNTVSACGQGGGQCAQCVTNQICLTDQTCGVDPQSSWLVLPTSASISSTNNGNDWDFGGGAPDPFVQLWCPPSASSVTSQTPSVTDSFSPTWSTGGCVMKAKDLLALGYAAEVWDADVSSNDIIAGKSNIAVTEKQLLQGSMTLSNNSTLLSMKVLLIKQ